MENEKRWKTIAISSTAASIALITGLIVIYWWSSTTVVLIIRHGERDDTASCPPTPNNPPLSAAGQQRAGVLAHVGEAAELQAIYASEFCRTQQTVEPLANQLGLTFNVVNQHATDGSANVDDLITRIKNNNTGQRILIAGHTNTIPLIIERLGGTPISPIAGSEFDNLYVVTIFRILFFKRTRVVQLKYGVAT